MKKQAQYGKGLSGFLSGLLLATAVIVGILFFLNKGGKQEFKELTRDNNKRAEPEVLQPQETPKSVPVPKPAEQPATPQEETDKAAEPEVLPTEKETASAAQVKEKEKVAEEKVSEPETIGDEEKPAGVPAVVPSVSKTDEERDAEIRAQRAAAEKRAAERRIAEQRRIEAEKKRAADKAAAAKKAASDKQKARSRQADKDQKADIKKEAAKKPAKPTPEQILDSGNIERARKAANEEAKKASAKPAKNMPESKAKNAGESGAAGSGKKVVLQMGSYANREAADAQRAKLAMMGVQSSVVESTANGKNIYRVQSGSMSQDSAKRVQQTLQKNGVSSFSRAAQ